MIYEPKKRKECANSTSNFYFFLSLRFDLPSLLSSQQPKLKLNTKFQMFINIYNTY